MDPFTAGLIACFIAWGTFGGGLRDTAAILKGQTPPSHAYRMAQMEAYRDAQAAAQGEGQTPPTRAQGSPGVAGAPPGAVPRGWAPQRITLGGLARNWWEDALEDVDAWKQRRRLSRPERKQARRERRAAKRGLIRRGYELLAERGRRRFHGGDGEAAPEGGQGADVVDLEAHRRTRDQNPGPDETAKKEEPQNQAQPEQQNQEQEKQDENEGGGRPEPPAATPGGDMSAPSAEGQTFQAHQEAFAQYVVYYRQCAERQEQVADRLEAEGASGAQITKAREAAAAYQQVAEKAQAAKDKHFQVHQGVYEQRQAHTGAAEGRYLTNR